MQERRNSIANALKHVFLSLTHWTVKKYWMATMTLGNVYEYLKEHGKDNHLIIYFLIICKDRPM